MADPVGRPGFRARMGADPAAATATGCLGVAVLASMDPTTLSVAGPVIAADLGTSISETQWIVNAFLLALSVLLVASGTASGRFGEMRMLRIGTAVFAGGAICAALAPTGLTLLVARAVQGIGAAAMIPAGIGLYRSCFEPARQPVAMAVYGGFCTAAAALGPVLAGLVLEVGSWRAVFAVIALTAILLSLLLVRAARAAPVAPRQAVDGLAMRINVALGIGLSAIAWALISSAERGWGDRGVAVVLTAGVLLVVWVLGRLAYGARDASTRGFASGRISPYLVLVVLTSIPNLGMVFLLSTFLQRAQALDPIAVAIAVLPCLGTTAVLMPLAGRLAAHVAPQLQIAAGLAVQLVALLLLTQVEADSSYATIGPPIALLGAGIALVVPTLLNGLLASAAPPHAALMGAANLSANQFGGILGVAVLGSLVATGLAPRFGEELAASGVPLRDAGARVELLATRGPERAAEGLSADRTGAVVGAGRRAYARSASVAIWLASGVAAFTLVLTLLFGRRLEVPGAPSAPRRGPPRKHGPNQAETGGDELPLSATV